jgi:uncharacterized membrane protein
MVGKLLFFIIFSLIGWVIDTGYRGLVSGKFKPATIIPYFATLYGIGGVGAVVIFEQNYTFLVHVVLASLFFILIEFFGGIFILKIFKKKLWDYSENFLNLKGHIDLLHSFYWVVLAIILRFVFPYVL